MRSFREALERFPDPQLLAAELLCPYGTVASWKYRDSIPSEYFEAIGAAARKLGVSGVSARVLRNIQKEATERKLAGRRARNP